MNRYTIHLSKETAIENTKKEIIRQCTWMLDTETEDDVWEYLIEMMSYISTVFQKQELPIKKKKAKKKVKYDS